MVTLFELESRPLSGPHRLRNVSRYAQSSNDRETSLTESLNLNTITIMMIRTASWAKDLQLLVEKMPNLEYFRISTAFKGDKTDDSNMSSRGEELFEGLPLFQSYLLRFGSFVTLRHPTLRFVAWSKSISDTGPADQVDGVVHYAIKPVSNYHLLGLDDMLLSSTAIRQATWDDLMLARAEDFGLHKYRGIKSESALDLDMTTSKTGRTAHAANSRIEHLVYLRSDEQRRLGLTERLDFEVLIEQARTGLLESKYSATYSAIQRVKNSIISVECRCIRVTAENSLHARENSSNEVPSLETIIANNIQSISNLPSRRPYKRGDLMEYMMNHDNLNDLGNAFAYEDCHLEPVKPKKQRAREDHKKKGNE